jgi:hypothetical protein
MITGGLANGSCPSFWSMYSLLSKSLPQTQLEALPSSAADGSNVGVFLLLFWLPHALFCFLLYFSSWFYLNCVTVSKWLCFIVHKLSTYCYYLFFSCLSTGYHSDPVRRLRRASNAAGGGGPRLAVPPRPTL